MHAVDPVYPVSFTVGKQQDASLAGGRSQGELSMDFSNLSGPCSLHVLYIQLMPQGVEIESQREQEPVHNRFDQELSAAQNPAAQNHCNSCKIAILLGDISPNPDCPLCS